MTSKSKKDIRVIACGVFERELDALKSDAQVDGLTVEILDAGLHAQPRVLRHQLQEAIDRVDPERTERIVLLYGFCGRGIIGLESRAVSLVVPRVHDCIALFLGDPELFRQQFKKNPGTYYLTPGWFEKRTHPDHDRAHSLQAGCCNESDPRFAEWSEKFGNDNAHLISEFYQSWRKNYRRIVLINNGLGEVDHYRTCAMQFASENEWVFEEISSDLQFIRTLVFGPYDERNFLTVPPYHRVISTHDARIISAVPIHADPSTAADGNDHRQVFDGPSDRTVRDAQTLGLGIDAGGTYTDAVVMELKTRKVFSKTKAPTRRQDLSIGIREAIEKLDASARSRVSLVSLSTTLATNAIVESRGASVGLILMPLNESQADPISLQPMRVVPGRLTIDGVEIEPVDSTKVQIAVRELLDAGVEAFAVSGYGSVHNPAHEQAIKSLIHRQTRLPVVCGHELSGKLDFIRRAYTAVLNARLMPLIDELLFSVSHVLKQYDIHAPVFVVRGDGSLIEASVARQRAIETILSGPAASAIGARTLTGRKDLLAIDMGGTTTDVAIMTDGELSLHEQGASVGPWRTSVPAADIQTTGLGGDSYVRLTDGGKKLLIGPERVIPLSFLADRHSAVLEELQFLQTQDHADASAIEFFEYVGTKSRMTLSDSEKRVIEALAKGPMSREKLAASIGAVSPSLIPTVRLEQRGIIRRSAFTPTDALHVLDRFTGFNKTAACCAAEIPARLSNRTGEQFAEWVCDEVSRELAYQILRRELSLRYDDPQEDTSPLLRKILHAMLEDGEKNSGSSLELACRTRRTIVGLGAPAATFIPQSARLMEAEFVVPEHAEVANAVGAVSGKVFVRQTISIRPDQTGSFVLLSPLGRKEFSNLDQARRTATDWLVSELRQQARLFGTDEQQVAVDVKEKTGQLADGSRQLLELIVRGTLTGSPRVDQISL